MREEEETLARHLRQHGPLSTAELIRLGVPLCNGLQALHARGQLHGDLRPESVVLSEPPALVASGLPQDPCYAAPEVLAGQPPTARSELYTMGAVFYEAVTGAPPFVGRTEDELRRLHASGGAPRLTGGHAPLADAIGQCLEPDPARRPPSAEALGSMLRLARLPETIAPDQAGLLDSRMGGPAGEDLVREKPGDLLGPYQLVKMLGAGAMGRVYLAQHVKLGRQTALKVLRTSRTRDPESVKRFFQEARTVNQINHEHIVEVFDFVEELTPDGNSLVFCVMELLSGASLSQLLAKERLPLSRIIPITRQICDALGAAHGVGVVHRDIKPDNVFLITRSGQADYVKVLDFGVAKVGAEAAGLGLVGTPMYMSPEQAAGLEVDPRADVYAVGNLLYEMLTGRPPFDAPDFAQLAAHVITQPPPPLPEKSIAGEKIPTGLKQQVLRALAKEPAQRHASMVELADAIAPFATVTEVLKRPLPAPRSRAPLLLAGVGLLAVVGIAAVALRTPEAPPPVVQAPAPDLHVQLVVASSPAGASVVRRDTGETLGVTPLSARVARTVDEIAIAVHLDGYRDAEQRVTLNANTTLNFTLDQIQVAAPAPPPPAKPVAAPPKPKKQKLSKESTLDPFAN